MNDLCNITATGFVLDSGQCQRGIGWGEDQGATQRCSDRWQHQLPAQRCQLRECSKRGCRAAATNPGHTTGKERGVAPWLERSLTVRWVVGSILYGVDPLSYFSFQPVLHDWCNKGRGMCYPVCGMMHIKEPLLLFGKSSLCGGSGFPLSLSEWSFTICLTPYNRK